jgi:hypothetical protein
MTTRHAVGALAAGLSPTAQYASCAGSDAEASLDNLLTVLRDIIDFQTFLVSQIDTAKSKLRIHGVQNSDPALTVPAGLEIPLTASPCQHVAHSVAPFSAADMHTDANLANLPVARDMGATSSIGVPIVLADGSFFGTLVGLELRRSNPPNTSHGCRSSLNWLHCNCSVAVRVSPPEHLRGLSRSMSGSSRDSGDVVGYINDPECQGPSLGPCTTGREVGADPHWPRVAALCRASRLRLRFRPSRRRWHAV